VLNEASAASATRGVIIHYHLFKNAGTSVDAILRRNFGDGWASREYPPRSDGEAAREFLVFNPHIAALSSHTLLLPPPEIPDAEIIPVIFIRHPLDRLKSAYLFEREQRADTVGVRLARENDFPGYLRARMAIPGDRSCRNFQTHRLAMAEPANGDTESARALRAFGRLPFIGSVEAFEASLAELERVVKPWFPEFRVFQARENVSRPPRPLEERMAALKAELGDELYEAVSAANAEDLELYDRALGRYLPQTGDGEGLQRLTGAPLDAGAAENQTSDGGTAEQIVEALRSNPEAYQAAAKVEGEVWGRVFSDADAKTVWEEDRIAAMRLRPGRGVSLARIFRERHLTFRSGLSLACGSGRAEREFLRLGICERFHGIDISQDVIAEARENGRGLDLTYEAADLNRVSLEPAAYDLVITQNCLHHVLELEHLAGEIWRSLKPGGYLWIHDYIGESQFQFSDLRLEIANRILEIVPERYRRDRLRNRVLSTIGRPKPGALASPFEAIRSAEIVPVFSRWFDIDYRHEESAFMGRVCPRGMRANYTETEDGPALFELMMLIESLLVEHRILAPHTGQYLMRRKPDLLRTQSDAEKLARTEPAAAASGSL
jgi:SAM-dependent methyltransferase